jgi:GNAT superfamily N-acetyltransferase
LVAIDKTTGVLVGGLELRLSDSSAFVNHVYVAPASRRGGCGRHLLNRAEFLAAGRPLSLDVDSENVAAKNLYRQFGLAVQSLLEWRAAAVAGFVPDGSDAYVSARGTDCGTTLVNRRVVRVPAGFPVWDAEVSQRTVARHGLTDGELLSVCIRPGSERLGRVVRLYERWSQQPAGKGT